MRGWQDKGQAATPAECRGKAPRFPGTRPGARPQRSKPVSAEADRRFFDLFMVVLAALVGISVLIYVISDRISDGTQKQYIAETAEYQQQVAERIAPVGNARLPGEADAATAAPVQAPPQPVAAELSGAQVYNANCGACHTNGIGGAPKLGDADAWAARAQQGLDTLRGHAVNGYQGEAGYMPAKGGNVGLSDEAVYRAVDYMLAESGQ